MHRPVRPKSAKGKTRPTRFSTTSSNEASTSTSISRTQRTNQHHGPNATETHDRNSMITRRISNAEKSTPSPQFPDITRPPSSLSKYRILPGITPTPPVDRGEGNSPQDNDVDWLTEQAQQLLLDSALQRQTNPKSPPTTTKRAAVVNTSVDNKRKKVYQTQSVFSHSSKQVVKRPPKPKPPKEPSANEERLLLALKLPDGTRVQRYFRPSNNIHEVLAYAQIQYPVLQMSVCDICRMDSIPKKIITQYSKSLHELGIQNRTVLYIEEKEDY
ncbi:uncharacterized protein LOC100183946 [Ciona intestinalis]